MRILVVGSGAREHALAWRLSLAGHELHAAPGNPGIARVAQCHDTGASDVEAQVALARALAVDLVVVGPEAPLALGLVDALSAQGIAAFGPTRAAAGAGVASIGRIRSKGRACLRGGTAGCRVLPPKFESLS